MIDSNSQFFAILTAVGEAKQANATALGTPWTFKEMAVGDANGTDPIPNRAQTKLVNEWRRAPVNQVRTDPANPNVIITEQVIPPDVGGRWIREIGLFDADGDLVAVANCAPSFKPLLAQGTGKTQVIRMNFIVANTAQIVLKIDPAVVLATREYVDNAVIEALAKLDLKHSAVVATTANIALSGIQTIDGVLLPADARVLVKNQTQAKDNGLYVVSSTGVWTRAQDADTSLEVTPGLFVSIEKGTVNGDSVWQLVTDGPIVLGTTPLAFEMAIGRTGISAGSYANVTVDKYGRVIAGTNPSTLAGHGITDTYTKAEIESIVAQSSSLPVGSMVAFPRASVPPGFLEIDGSVQSIAAYPDLAAYLGTSFNKGDEGAGNFRLPESRGEFLRGWDHGRGVDAGRGLGSWQADEFKSHFHTTNNTSYVGSDPTLWVYGDAGSGSITPPSVQTNTAGGIETRPRNLAVMWCIKAWNAPINQGNIDVAALAPLAAQATEINQGTAKVATNAQMLDSANDFVMPTPKKLRWGLSVSLAANGYIAAPFWLGGWVIQWGTTGAVSSTPAVVSFPMAFPSVAYVALAIGYLGETNVASNQDAIYSFGLSKNGVSFKTYGSVVANGAKYIAIGS
ncbi:phage tail protein [Pseudomonas protegens]|uniref:phage tail-collar fiber domain-containing protein n=1 Tax=Pseudomonas protegens TaxID=380021 RepID=UPI000E1F8EF7|nr:phage tail protein [Pseudomonas protegens]AXK55937.1 phage tail protein [Pseudomonas protegens]